MSEDAVSVVAKALRDEGITKWAYSCAMAALDALRSLPVGERMEAMGMTPLGGSDPHGRKHYVEVRP